jgi:TetR/AcrR family transcriptional regulator, regulator of biofilm formation and stress response
MSRGQSRGERRREAILRATLSIIGRHGTGAVTHRAVAEEAGVPLASTTYYFASKDELLEQAFDLAARDEVARLEAVVRDLQLTDADPATWIESTAATLAGELAREPEVRLATLELLLEAARRPAVRESVSRGLVAYRGLAHAGAVATGSPAPKMDAEITVAVVTGLALLQLADPHERYESEVLRPALQRLNAALVPPAAEPEPDRERTATLRTRHSGSRRRT